MAFTHNLDLAWSRGNDQVSQRITKSGGREVNLSEPIPDSSTNLSLPLIGLDISALKTLYLVADQDLTVKTNSSTEPDDTLTLESGQPLVWWDGNGFAAPFSEDVATLFVTNASGDDAVLQLFALLDATP